MGGGKLSGGKLGGKVEQKFKPSKKSI